MKVSTRFKQRYILPLYKSFGACWKYLQVCEGWKRKVFFHVGSWPHSVVVVVAAAVVAAAPVVVAVDASGVVLVVFVCRFWWDHSWLLWPIFMAYYYGYHGLLWP